VKITKVDLYELEIPPILLEAYLFWPT